jgi:hypothetical protein
MILGIYFFVVEQFDYGLQNEQVSSNFFLFEMISELSEC